MSVNPVFEKSFHGFYASKSRPSVLVAEEFFDHVVAVLLERFYPLAVCGRFWGMGWWANRLWQSLGSGAVGQTIAAVFLGSGAA